MFSLVSNYQYHIILAKKIFNPKSDDDSDQDVIYEYEGFYPINMQDFLINLIKNLEQFAKGDCDHDSLADEPR